MNIAKMILDHALNKFGKDHDITIYNNRVYNYNDYLNIIKQLQDKLLKLFQKNEIVVIVSDDSPLLISMFLACILLDLKPVIISYKSKLKYITNILEIIGTDTYITLNMENQFNDSQLSHIDVSGFENDNCIKIRYSNNYMHQQQCLNCKCRVAYIGLSSGTSGEPKLILYSHEGIESAIRAYAINVLKIKKEDILYSIPKMSYTYGLANSLFFSLYTGAKSILTSGGFNLEEVNNNLCLYKPTFFFAVPSIYEKILQSQIIDEVVVSTLKHCISSGDRLSRETFDRWLNKYHLCINDSVGISETGNAFLYNDKPIEKKGSVGKQIIGYSLLIESEEENIGNLVVKGESVAIGYLEKNNIIKYLGQQINTNDIYKRDEDGYYWFVGRNNNLLKYNGLWVSSDEVSKVIKNVDGVVDAVVFKMGNPYVSCLACALIVDNNFKGISNLKSYVKDNIEHYKVPKLYKILPNFPLTINDKVDIKKIEIEMSKYIITLDGPAKTGKSTMAKEICDLLKIEDVNVGLLFRIIAYLFRDYSKIPTLSQLHEEFRNIIFLGNRILYKNKDYTKILSGNDMAMDAAIIAQNPKVQDFVYNIVKNYCKEKSCVVEGREMGTYLFQDAAIKIYLTCSPEKRVSKWCEMNNYNDDVYEYSLRDMKRRNYLDRNRLSHPLDKPDDAFEIVIDDKTNDEVFSEIKHIVNQFIQIDDKLWK